jgi:hypothetical protein
VHWSGGNSHDSLPADYTFGPLDQGLHTFAGLVLRTPGPRSLQLSDQSPVPAVGSSPIDVGTFLVTGADAGGAPEVKVFDSITGTVRFDFMAYDVHFLGGVRVAVADVTGDGVPDIITAAGPGGGPQVNVFDGVTGQLVRAFMAYSPAFMGGVFVAAGDLNGDGKADIVTGPDQSGGPDVKVFSGATGQVTLEFLAYPAGFLGGVRVAVGDVNGDGTADIVTGAGPGGGPQVEVFNGANGRLLQSFFALAPQFTGGVYVAAGDVNGDGRADIIVGAGAGGGPQVEVFSGANDAILESFLAYGGAFGGGVRVGAADLSGNGRVDILTGAGPGGGPHAQALDGSTLATVDSFFAYNASFGGGIFIGGL